MKRRIPTIVRVPSLGFLCAAGIVWYLSHHGMSQAHQEVARPKAEGDVQQPEPPAKLAAVKEVAPLLKRQPPQHAEDFFQTLPPVELDKFGDITPDLYLVPYETFMRIFNAQKVANSERELANIQQEWLRESREYMRQHFPEAYRLLSEKKPEWVEQLAKERTRKDGDRQGLVSAVMAARPALAMRGNFRLGGIVVDEDARPCSDVTVEVSKEASSLTKQGWPISERFTGVAQVAGSFLLRIDDAQRVTLGFHKPGYYEVRSVEFSVPEPTEASYWEIVLLGKKMPTQEVEHRNLRIVMEKQGKLTLLTSGGGTLEFRRDGTGDVLKMGVNADGHWFMRGTRDADISIRPPKHLPEKCVYVVPKTDDQGRIILTKLSALQSRRAKQANGGPDDESQYVYAPTAVRLVVSDPQGGFVRYEPQPGREIRPDRPWSRDMKEAPKEGYVHELLLDGETVEKLYADPDEPQPAYFYIKAFGKYGKGQLSNLRIVLKEAPRKSVNGQLEPIRYLLDEAGLAAQIQILKS